MAPIVLKIKEESSGNNSHHHHQKKAIDRRLQSCTSLLPFLSSITETSSEEDLSKTWKVCTKVRDSLENGPRLENLSWRLWFAHNISKTRRRNGTDSHVTMADLSSQQLPIDTLTAEADYRRKLCLQQRKQATDQHVFDDRHPHPHKATTATACPQWQHKKGQELTLYPFTPPDQAKNRMIELKDIFDEDKNKKVQAYFKSLSENEQEIDSIIHQSWPMASDNNQSLPSSFSSHPFDTTTLHPPWNDVHPLNAAAAAATAATVLGVMEQNLCHSITTPVTATVSTESSPRQACFLSSAVPTVDGTHLNRHMDPTLLQQQHYHMYPSATTTLYDAAHPPTTNTNDAYHPSPYPIHNNNIDASVAHSMSTFGTGIHQPTTTTSRSSALAAFLPSANHHTPQNKTLDNLPQQSLVAATDKLQLPSRVTQQVKAVTAAVAAAVAPPTEMAWMDPRNASQPLSASTMPTLSEPSRADPYPTMIHSTPNTPFLQSTTFFPTPAFAEEQEDVQGKDVHMLDMMQTYPPPFYPQEHDTNRQGYSTDPIPCPIVFPSTLSSPSTAFNQTLCQPQYGLSQPQPQLENKNTRLRPSSKSLPTSRASTPPPPPPPSPPSPPSPPTATANATVTDMARHQPSSTSVAVFTSPACSAVQPPSTSSSTASVHITTHSTQVETRHRPRRRLTTTLSNRKSDKKDMTSTAIHHPSPQCSNCQATSTPLWRRSAKDELLCNACGLYFKLHKVPRPKYLKPHQASLKKEESHLGKHKSSERANDHPSRPWRRRRNSTCSSSSNSNSHRSDDGSSRNNERVDKMSESSCHPTTRGTTHYRPPNMQCSNCGTCTTPLWRRDTDGSSLCNACGLYLKLHNEKRPLSMKTDHFKKRQRCGDGSNVATTLKDHNKEEGVWETTMPLKTATVAPPPPPSSSSSSSSSSSPSSSPSSHTLPSTTTPIVPNLKKKTKNRALSGHLQQQPPPLPLTYVEQQENTSSEFHFFMEIPHVSFHCGDILTAPATAPAATANISVKSNKPSPS